MTNACCRSLLLGQAEAAHEVGEAGVGAEGVEGGVADFDQQFVVFIGVGFFEILEGQIAISGQWAAMAIAAERSAPVSRVDFASAR
jgi:hypothetical protein